MDKGRNQISVSVFHSRITGRTRSVQLSVLTLAFACRRKIICQVMEQSYQRSCPVLVTHPFIARVSIPLSLHITLGSGPSFIYSRISGQLLVSYLGMSMLPLLLLENGAPHILPGVD